MRWILCLAGTVLLVSLVRAATETVAAFPALVTLRGPNTTVLDIPSTGEATYITINLCAAEDGDPEVWLTNSSVVAARGIGSVLGLVARERKPGPLWRGEEGTGMRGALPANEVVGVDGKREGLQLEGTAMVWKVSLWNGFGNWTGRGGEGVWIEVNLRDGMEMEVGIDDQGPIHAVSTLPAMLGDTTATQALILSPIIAKRNTPPPTYPDYRIASPYPLNESLPLNGTVMRVMVLPTGESPAARGLESSLCAVRRAEGRTGALGRAEGRRWQQRPEGWRWAFVVGGLEPLVNYTAWVLEDASAVGGRLWQPIMMRTKEETFPCPLVHSLALCPSIAYAAALDPDNDIDDPTYAVTLLPDATTRTLEQSLDGFSAALMAQACGRDLYSPVWTCQDCMDEYREWLCRTLVPRCAGSDPTGTARQKTVRVASRATGHVPGPGYEYTRLLPCLANCRRVDRKCPVNLQFRCPLRGKTANMTYAYVGAEEEDGGRGEGEEDGGVDEWGNRWCNGGLPG